MTRTRGLACRLGDLPSGSEFEFCEPLFWRAWGTLRALGREFSDWYGSSRQTTFGAFDANELVFPLEKQ